MKKSILYLPVIVVFLAWSLSACSGHSSAAGDKSSSSNSASSGSAGDTTYDGENSLSYTINGRRKTIKDYMHNGDGKNYMSLYRGSVKNNAETGRMTIDVTNEQSSEVFKFSVANSGATVILHYRPSLGNLGDHKVNSMDYMSPKYKNYYADSVSVTITGTTATSVTGTFAGRFLTGDDKPVPLEITEGRFDLQFTKEENH